MNAPDAFDHLLANLRPAPLPESLAAKAHQVAQIMAAQAPVARSPVDDMQAALIAHEMQRQPPWLSAHQSPTEQGQVLPGTIPPIGEYPAVVGIHGTLPLNLPAESAVHAAGVMQNQGFAAHFASVQQPQGDKRREPWPCGPSLTHAEWNHIDLDISGFMELEAHKLDGFGPDVSEKACEFIKRGLGRNPAGGTTALRAVRAGLPPGSSLGARIDDLITCGDALSDMKPLTDALNGPFMLWGSQDQTQDPCVMAENALRQDIGLNPAAWAAKLAGIAARIVPRNKLAQQLLNQLQGIAAGIAMGTTPQGLGIFSGVDIRTGAAFSLQNLYERLTFGDVCDCPKPGTYAPA